MRRTELLDLYGALLTEKQRSCAELYVLEDLSLSEIGEALGISRQAAHDNIQRSIKALEEYEEKLGFAARCRSERKEIGEVCGLLRKLAKEDIPAECRETVDDSLRKLIPFTGSF